MGCQVIAKMNKKKVTLDIVDDERKNSAAFKELNVFGKFPMLETKEGVLHESVAIAKYLAHGHASLLGTNDVERAQIDQWTNWVLELSFKTDKACCAIISAPISKEDFNALIKDIKDSIRTVNGSFTDGYLVGNSITLADVMVASILTLPFQVLLDEGFRKTAQKVFEWFERVAQDADFKAIFGRMRICSKAYTPVFAAAEE
jgi:elongation factor 1-gamma